LTRAAAGGGRIILRTRENYFKPVQAAPLSDERWMPRLRASCGPI
jgi:hypothetical protein